MSNQHNNNSLVLKLKDNSEKFGGKEFDKGVWDDRKNFLKNIADNIYIAPTEKQLLSIDKYNKKLLISRDIAQEWANQQDDKQLKLYFTSLDKGQASVKGLTASLNKMTLSSKIAAGAMQALSIAGNMALMAGITFLLSIPSRIAQSQEEALRVANDTAKTLKDDVKTIDEYKVKITELQKALQSENLSQAVAYDKRKELITIQDSLIEKYGTEKSVIDTVTEAINGNVDALERFNKESWNSWYSKNNTKGFWDNMPWDGKSVIEEAKEFMEGENAYYINSFIQNTRKSKLSDFITKDLADTIGKDNGTKIGIGTGGLSVFGDNPEKILSTLKNIREEYINIIQMKFPKDWETQGKEILSSIDNQIQYYQDGINTYKDTYQTYIQGKIAYESEYSDEYADILEKRSKLEEAHLSGSKDEIEKAQTELFNALNNAYEISKNDFSILNYFKSMYPELKKELAKYQFKVDIGVNSENLPEEIKNALDNLNGLDDIGILNIGTIEGTSEQEVAFDTLSKKAKEYGASVEELISWLVELGIVQGQPVPNPPLPSFDLDIISDNLTEFNTEIEKIYTKFDILKKAEEEFSKTGKITAETFKSLSDNNLIQYLDFTSDGLNILNNDLLKNEQALKKKAQADLAAALYTDLLALATSGVSDEQKKAEKNAQISGNTVMTMGEQFAHSATGVMTAAMAMDTFNSVAKGEGKGTFDFEGQEEQFNKLIDNYNKAVSSIQNLINTSDTMTNLFVKQLDDITNKTSVLGTAWKEMNEAGKLSTATITKLIETDEDWEKSLDIVNGKVIINKETLVQSAKEIINAKKVETQAMIDDSEKQIEALKNTALAQLNMSQMFSKLNGFSGADIDKYYEEQKLLIENNKLTGKKLEELNKLLQDIADCNKHLEIFNALENDLSSDDPFGVLGDSASKLKSQLSSMNSSVNSLLSTTIEMLKKGYELIKKGIQDDIDTLDKQHDLDTENLDKNLEKTQKAYEKEKKALEDKLKLLEAERDARLKTLQVLKDEYDWQKKLDNHNKTIADLKTRLKTAELDDSETGRALVKDLQQQLADAENALKDDQFDKNIERQENAVNDEFDKAKELYDNKLDLLDKEQQVLETSHKAQLERIEKEYQVKKENLEKQIKDIENYLSTEVGVRNEALALIDEGSQEFYDRLIEYNTLYCDGVDQNVRNMWNNAYISLDKFNAGQRTTLDILNELSEAMNDFAKEIGMAVDKANNLSRALGNVDQNKPNITVPKNTTKPSNSSNTNSSSNSSFDIFGELGSLFENLFGDMEIHHSGADSGFVGGVVPKLKENEKFAKLLKGELVINKNDMNSLLNNIPNIALSGINNIAQNFYKTIPNIPAVTNKSSEIKINQGDIIVQGSMDKSVLPMVKQMLKDNSREIADMVGKEFSRAAGLSGIRSKKYI